MRAAGCGLRAGRFLGGVVKANRTNLTAAVRACGVRPWHLCLPDPAASASCTCVRAACAVVVVAAVAQDLAAYAYRALPAMSGEGLGLLLWGLAQYGWTTDSKTFWKVVFRCGTAVPAYAANPYVCL